MQMADRLATVGAGVDDDSIAFGEALLSCDLSGGGEELTEQFGVLGCRGGERGEVLPGDDEQVRGSLRVQVGESYDSVVFVDEFGGDCAGDDFAEDAVGNAHGLTSYDDFGAGLAKALDATGAKERRKGRHGFCGEALLRCRGRYFLKYFGSASGAHGS